MESFCSKVLAKRISFSKTRRKKPNKKRFSGLGALRGKTKVEIAEKSVPMTIASPSPKMSMRKRVSINEIIKPIEVLWGV